MQENIDAEIMQVILDEARESYDEEIVIELQSDSVEEMESNVDRITGWVTQWRKDNK
jgi:adenylate kinase